METGRICEHEGRLKQRIYMISAWREVPQLYSARERAALAWAESDHAASMVPYKPVGVHSR